MHPAKLKSVRWYRNLARSGALAGPGYTHFDFLGVRLTQRSKPGDDRRARFAARLSREPVAVPILISATWVPYGTPVDSDDPDQVWLCSVDIHELNTWAQRTDAGCLIFATETHKAGREITVHFVPKH